VVPPGSVDDLALALSTIEEGPCRGLFLRSQVSLYAPANVPVDHPLLLDIPVTTEGFVLLGSPFGSTGHSESIVSKRVHKVQEILSRLGDLQDWRPLIFHSCLSPPKVASVLSICPPDVIQGALGAFDGIVGIHCLTW
jgi:hypothetical protein